jgi:hypothetical protein
MKGKIVTWKIEKHKFSKGDEHTDFWYWRLDFWKKKQALQMGTVTKFNTKDEAHADAMKWAEKLGVEVEG